MSQPEIPRGAQKYRMWANECQSSLATLANSIWSKARSLRSRIPPGGPEGPINEAFNRGILGRNRSKNGQNGAINGPFNRGITWQKLSKNDKNGQRTDPSTGELHAKSAKKWRKSAKSGKKRQKTPDLPGASRNTPGSLTRHNVRLLSNFPLSYPGFNLGSPMKTRIKRTV